MMKIYKLKNIMCDPPLPDGDYYDKAEVDELFDRALDRIKDMLLQDDGQAYKEAERFYRQYRRDLDESM